MKNNINFKIKGASNIKEFFSGITKKAEVDWVIVLFICLAMVVGLSVFSWIKYKHVMTTADRVSGGEVSFVELNESGLEKIEIEFSAKKSLSESLKKGYVGVGDPSL